MTAPSGGITISDTKLYELIAQGLGGDPISAKYVSLGPTGRKFRRNIAWSGEPERMAEFQEQADFGLAELLDYDEDIELDDDSLQFTVEAAVLEYVAQHAAEWRGKVLHHAEAFKQELLSHPAGE